MQSKYKPLIIISIIMLFIMLTYGYFKKDQHQSNNVDTTNIAIITKTLDYYDPLYAYRIDVVKAINDKFDNINIVVNSSDKWLVDRVVPSFDQQLKLIKELSIGADILIIELFDESNKDMISDFLKPLNIDVYFIDINYQDIAQKQKLLINDYLKDDQNIIYLNIADFDKKDRNNIKQQLLDNYNLNEDDLYVCDNEIITFSLYDALKELKIENNNIIGYGMHPAVKSLIDKQLILNSVDFNVDNLINNTINYLYEVMP